MNDALHCGCEDFYAGTIQGAKGVRDMIHELSSEISLWKAVVKRGKVRVWTRAYRDVGQTREVARTDSLRENQSRNSQQRLKGIASLLFK